MRKIDIKTSQNVTIVYELATVVQRSLATLIDLIIILLASLIINKIIKTITGEVYADYMAYVFFPLSFFYHLLMETLNHGQSPGKKIFKIRVVKINGERPGFFDFFMRTAFRGIDILLTLGSLALITVSSSEKGQRLGDFLADTTVIRLINMENYTLTRVLSLNKLKDYTPVYPNVIQYKEEEMLLVKEVLDRYTKFPNPKHTEALNLLVQKIEGQLGIVAPKNKYNFLNTLIRDYVSLTR